MAARAAGCAVLAAVAPSASAMKDEWRGKQGQIGRLAQEVGASAELSIDCFDCFDLDLDRTH